MAEQIPSQFQICRVVAGALLAPKAPASDFFILYTRAYSNLVYFGVKLSRSDDNFLIGNTVLNWVDPAPTGFKVST